MHGASTRRRHPPQGARPRSTASAEPMSLRYRYRVWRGTRRYLRRYRRPLTPGRVLGPLAVLLVLAGVAAHAPGAPLGQPASPAVRASGAAAAVAIAYARAQIGKPYCWGGTGTY